MFKPLFKQYCDLTLADFRAHPIWMCIHGVDDEEPWAADGDELTHRPYPGPVPYVCSNPQAPMVLVSTRFKLADGTEFEGFSNPPFFGETPALGVSYRQPQMFLPDGRRVGFWFGTLSQVTEGLRELYSTLSRRSSEVFPITYRIAPGLTDCDDENAGIIGLGTMALGSCEERFQS